MYVNLLFDQFVWKKKKKMVWKIKIIRNKSVKTVEASAPELVCFTIRSYARQSFSNATANDNIIINDSDFSAIRYRSSMIAGIDAGGPIHKTDRFDQNSVLQKSPMV